MLQRGFSEKISKCLPFGPAQTCHALFRMNPSTHGTLRLLVCSLEAFSLLNHLFPI
jgi:hypothetical protein